jgi:nitroimidazol reductase NimA-like FMN-containing flavoprotein (pyridoxamine 5'-phosphate oxidase superfamily)
MVEIVDMEMPEIIALLQEVDYAHLACARNNHPYIVPIHYVYREPFLYICTSEGKKTDILAKNPEVCMQAEKVKSASQWRSVILSGKVQRLEALKRAEALAIIRDRNPALTPARSRTWKDNWGFQHVEVIYRIRPDAISGRKTL